MGRAWFQHIDAVLFDLDGTLVDTLDDLHAATTAATTAFGYRALSAEEVRGCIGSGVNALIERALQIASGREPTAACVQSALEVFRTTYDQCNGRHSRLYPGVAWALKRLRAMELPLALVTNKPLRFVQPLLLRHGLLGAFDAVVAGDTTGWLKPAPEPLLHACAEIGVPPACALMVGDSPVDASAARAAGCAIACVTHGYAPVAELARIQAPLLTGFEELADRLAQSPLPSPLPTTSRRPWA